MNLKTATPAEIDTKLSEIWGRAGVEFSKATEARQRGRRHEADALRHKGKPVSISRTDMVEYHTEAAAKAEATSEKHAAAGREIAKESAPFDAEFSRRGGWNRYYLVTNSNGHVHRERHCGTCFPTTEYAWLIDLADCDEKVMVAEHGEQACTVCFPDAPTMKGWGEFAAKRDAAEGRCDASRYDYVNHRTGEKVNVSGAYVKCAKCDYMGRTNANAVLRKHKVPKA